MANETPLFAQLLSNLERANSQPTAAHGTVEVDGANCLSRTFITFIKIAISGESVHGELPPAIISVSDDACCLSSVTRSTLAGNLDTTANAGAGCWI